MQNSLGRLSKKKRELVELCSEVFDSISYKSNYENFNGNSNINYFNEIKNNRGNEINYFNRKCISNKSHLFSNYFPLNYFIFPYCFLISNFFPKISHLFLQNFPKILPGSRKNSLKDSCLTEVMQKRTSYYKKSALNDE